MKKRKGEERRRRSGSEILVLRLGYVGRLPKRNGCNKYERVHSPLAFTVNLIEASYQPSLITGFVSILIGLVQIKTWFGKFVKILES